MDEVNTLEDFYLPLVVVEESFDGLGVFVVCAVEDSYYKSTHTEGAHEGDVVIRKSSDQKG